MLTKRGINNSAYEAYNRDQQKLGIFGRRHTDQRLPAKERILGVMADGEAMAFPIARVREPRLVEAEVGALVVPAAGPLAVLLVAAAEDLPVLAYNRRVSGRRLTFELVPGEPPTLRDRETGSTWRLADGVATAGPLKDQRLERVAAHPAFWFGWRNYFPRSEVWPPDETRSSPPPQASERMDLVMSVRAASRTGSSAGPEPRQVIPGRSFLVRAVASLRRLICRLARPWAPTGRPRAAGRAGFRRCGWRSC